MVCRGSSPGWSAPARAWPVWAWALSGLLLLALSGPVCAQDVRYVTDKLRLSVYPKSNGEGERLGVLSSGTKVTVLKANGAYVKVRTQDGLEGWVKGAYLQKEPTAARRVATLEQENRQLHSELERLRGQLAERSAEPPPSAPEGDPGTDARVAALEEELRSLQTVHQALLEEYRAQQARLDERQPASQERNPGPPTRSGVAALAGTSWLSIGALVLLVGLLAGMALGRHAAERRLRRRFHGFDLE